MGRPKTSTVCVVDGCGAVENCRGLCKRHYLRRSRGDLSLPLKESKNPKMPEKCIIECCDRGGRLVRGYCQGHYSRYKAHGYVEPTPLRSMRDPLGSPQERLDRATDKSGECWIWTGLKNNAGYGYLSVNNKATLVHRLSYDLYHNTKSESCEVVHHTCATKDCVKPEHLQRVSRAENTAEMLERRELTERIAYLEGLLTDQGIEH